MARLSSVVLFLGTVIFLSLAVQNAMGSEDQHKEAHSKQLRAVLKDFRRYSADLKKDDDQEISIYLNYLPLYMLLNGSQFTQCSILITLLAIVLGYVIGHDFLTIPLHK